MKISPLLVTARITNGLFSEAQINRLGLLGKVCSSGLTILRCDIIDMEAVVNMSENCCKGLIGRLLKRMIKLIIIITMLLYFFFIRHLVSTMVWFHVQ